MSPESRLIKNSNIHDVKKLLSVILKSYVTEEDRSECMKEITALLNLLASETKKVENGRTWN